MVQDYEFDPEDLYALRKSRDQIAHILDFWYESVQDSEQVFYNHDVDDSGSLSFDEVLAAESDEWEYFGLHIDVDEDSLDTLLNDRDVDQDGELNLEEYVELSHDMYLEMFSTLGSILKNPDDYYYDE